jgi:hypothetical protein
LKYTIDIVQSKQLHQQSSQKKKKHERKHIVDVLKPDPE